MNCSMIAWAATPNAFLARFCSSFGKSLCLWFAGCWIPVVEICVFLWLLTGVSRIFYQKQSEFLPHFFCWVRWCFWRFVLHSHARGSGSSLVCLFPRVDCGFRNLFGTNLQTVWISLSNRQKWALSLWGIWTISRFCWCCWNWQSCCYSPIVEGPKEPGMLQLSQGCSHCEIGADLWSGPSFVFLTKFQRSSSESLLELLSRCDESVPAPESFRLLVWQARDITSGQRSSMEPSPVFSWFSELLFVGGYFRNNNGTIPNLWVEQKIIDFRQST